MKNICRAKLKKEQSRLTSHESRESTIKQYENISIQYLLPLGLILCILFYLYFLSVEQQMKFNQKNVFFFAFFCWSLFMFDVNGLFVSQQ